MKIKVNICLGNLIVSSPILNYYNMDDFKSKIQKAKELTKRVLASKTHSNFYCSEEKCNLTHRIIA